MKKNNTTAWLIVLALIILAGLFLRIYDLELDPPTQISINSQSLITDPPHLTSFAANWAKTGESEPFPFPKWQVFKVTLVSGVAYLIFAIAGISLTASNLAGVIPSIIGLILIVFSGYKKDNQWLKSAILRGGFLMFLFPLLTFNRAPFMESGLICYMGLAWFLYFKFGNKPLNLALLGFVIAAACLTGKIFGLALGFAIGLSILLNPEKRWKSLGIFIASLFIASVLLLIILFGSKLGAYWTYFHEQAFSSHGELYIVSNFPETIRSMFLFGTRNGLYKDTPFFFLAFILVFIRLMINLRDNRSQTLSNVRPILALFWIIGLMLMLLPGNYHPLRYAILFYLPMVIIISEVYHLDIKGHAASAPVFTHFVNAIIALAVFYFLIHLILDFFLWNKYSDYFWTVFVAAILPAVLFVFLSIKSRTVTTFFSRKKIFQTVIVSLLGLSVIYQSYAFYSWVDSNNYALRNGMADAEQIMASDAVVTGPYAPALTLDGPQRHFIFAFGLEKPDFDIFGKFGITHIAVDNSNLAAAQEKYPYLKNAFPLAEYYLRQRQIVIMRLDTVGNLSDYERAMFAMLNGDLDSAQFYNDRFCRAHPQNRSGIMQNISLMLRSRSFDNIFNEIELGLRLYPNDGPLLYLAATAYKRLGKANRRSEWVTRADEMLERVMELSGNNSFLREKYNNI